MAGNEAQNMNAVLVALLFVPAAAAGAVLRFVAAGYLNHEFPFGTIGVNLISSFVLGLIAAAADPLPVVVGAGALGALSTWSTAANEAAIMARDGYGSLALGYLALTTSSGVLLAWFGLVLGPTVF